MGDRIAAITVAVGRATSGREIEAMGRIDEDATDPEERGDEVSGEVGESERQIARQGYRGAARSVDRRADERTSEAVEGNAHADG